MASVTTTSGIAPEANAEKKHSGNTIGQDPGVIWASLLDKPAIVIIDVLIL